MIYILAVLAAAVAGIFVMWVGSRNSFYPVFSPHGAVDYEDSVLAHMMPLFLDRLLLQSRLKAAFQKLSEYPLVDAKRIGAIGFCFGGLCVLELLRSGVPVRGVVSFHGVLGNKMGDKQAKTVPIANHINGSALILHGHDDPLVSNEDISALTKELTQAKIDWQFMHYGHTSHAFSNPEANNAASGMLYNEAAARRSWLAMINFFNEIFQFYG